MKKIAVIFLIGLSLGGIVYAQAQSDLKTAVEDKIRTLSEDGTEITYSAAEADGMGYTLRNVTIIPENQKARFEADWVTLTPSAAKPGDIVVTIAPSVLMTIISDMPTGNSDEMIEFNIGLETDGFELVTNWVAEAVGQPVIDITADSMRFISRDKDHPVLTALDILQTGVELHVLANEAAGEFEISARSDAVSLNYGFEIAEQGQSVQANGTVDGFEISASGSKMDIIKDFAAFIDGGGHLEFAVRSGASNGTSVITGGEMPMSLSGTSGASSAELRLKDGRFAYNADFTSTQYNVIPDASVVPVPPFSVSLSSGRMALDLPVAPGAGSSEGTFEFFLKELAVDEGLWAMIDPGATIPRDPANIEIGLTAQLQIAALPGAEAGGKAAGKGGTGEVTMPDNPFDLAKIEGLNIDVLRLNLAGAAVNAGGALTFDNSGPVPAPLGSVNVSVEGVNALSGKLVELGLIDQMQAGMAMGMMMAFAKPGDKPDLFVSEVEFTSEGILANGAPVQ